MTTSLNLSRRSLLKVSAMGAASVGMGLGFNALDVEPSMAQGTPTVADEAAFYRFKIGDFQITMIHDGFFNFPAAIFGANVEPKRVTKLLDSFYLPTDVVTGPIHCMLIETGQQKILIDTGMGPYVLPGDVANSGKLMDTLALLGINPADIDKVILTHGHPDHIGGASTEGNPSFPNARYIIPQPEWDFWTSKDGDADPFLDFMFKVANASLLPLQNQLDQIPYDQVNDNLNQIQHEIVPGIALIKAPGHTLGHVAVLISSGEEQLLHTVDISVHYIIGPQRPRWHLAVEMDPNQAFRTRKRLFGAVSRKRMLVCGYHFPFPGIGYLVEGDEPLCWKFLPTG